MPWSTSNRRAKLPGNWQTLRRTVFTRDGNRCTTIVNGQRCTQTDRLECHHLGADTDHRIHMLATVCHTHHTHHTVHDAHNAMRQRRQSALHPREQHPGLS